MADLNKIASTKSPKSCQHTLKVFQLILTDDYANYASVGISFSISQKINQCAGLSKAEILVKLGPD